MPEPKLTVVVPTYNRMQLLRATLDSVLGQDYHDFRVVVLDNNSSDGTPQVVETYAARDPRVSSVRNAHNIGLIRNWNKAFAINRSPYVSVFHDDDVMLPGFLSTTIAALDEHPTAAFALVGVQIAHALASLRT